MKTFAMVLCCIISIVSEIAMPVIMFFTYKKQGYLAIGGEYIIVIIGIIAAIMGVYYAFEAIKESKNNIKTHSRSYDISFWK